MGSKSQLGFVNHQRSCPNPTSVSPKEEPTSHHSSGAEGEARAARQSKEQAAFLAVVSHIKQLCSSLLSPSEAKSLVHVTPNAPKPRESGGGGMGGSCSGSRGSSQESKKHKFPVPSAGGSTALFPKFWGLPGGQ